jgi:hypothetical protein
LTALRRVNPDNAILPVLLVDPTKGIVKRVLGTGFFFSSKPIILSAAHVLGVQPGRDEAIAVPKRELPDPEPGVVMPQPWMAAIFNVRVDPKHDLAVADVPGVTHFEHFPVCRQDPPALTTVMTVDLVSRMTFELVEGGGPGPTITPYTWKGYVHSVLITQEPTMRARARIFEVSIPVVQGMSGAPLIEARTLRVAGVLFGNVARQLIPPPYAKAEGEKWYLPVGQALHWSHVRQFLESIGQPCD